MKFKSRKITLQLTRKQQVVKQGLAVGYLAFHRHITNNTEWVVTHIPTGLAVCKSRDKQAVKRYVKAYGNESFWCDWEECKDVIRLSIISPNLTICRKWV